MKKNEIVELEDCNCDKLYLFLEGIFWKAYEKSAFLFVTEVKPYRPIKKAIKKMNTEVVSIGFPASLIEQIKQDLSVIEESEKRIVCKAPKPLVMEEFAAWKSSIELVAQDAKPLKQNGGRTVDLLVIDKIKNFNIADRTPMECMQFISELKAEILLYLTKNALYPVTCIQSIL